METMFGALITGIVLFNLGLTVLHHRKLSEHLGKWNGAADHASR